MIRTTARRARPPHDRRLEAIGAMLAAAADALAIAYGYGAALDVPPGARLPQHAAETIARACGDDAPAAPIGGQHAAA